jgi:Icc protein
MLIAQITDLHIGFEADNPDELNVQRLRAVLESLRALDRAPDLVLATGDLTDNGTLQSYKDLKAIFEDCPWPVWPSLGNHDVRDNFYSGFSRDIPHSQFRVCPLHDRRRCQCA